MKTRFSSITLLAAVTALGLGIAPAVAADANSASAVSGYVYPGFWGTPAGQSSSSAAAPKGTDGSAIGTYATETSHGTWLFPPDPNSGS
jgi:hypothetical protein